MFFSLTPPSYYEVMQLMSRCGRVALSVFISPRSFQQGVLTNLPASEKLASAAYTLSHYHGFANRANHTEGRYVIPDENARMSHASISAPVGSESCDE